MLGTYRYPLLPSSTRFRTGKMEEFEEIIKTIYFFAHEYGHKKFLEKNPRLNCPDKNTFPSYLEYCHEGFYKAQEIIVDQLIFTQKAQQSIKKRQKEARRKKDSKQTEKIGKRLQEEKYKELLLRHAADSIAWQIIRGKHHIAKRLFANEQQPSLLGNNLESLLDYIKFFKKESPSGFCLISDTTSFIQTGDLVCIADGKILIIEMKAGTINKKIIEILDRGEPEGEKEFCRIAHKKGIGFVKQFNRVLNQKRTLYEVSNILKNDEGYEPRLKKNIKIFDPGNPEEFYFESISKLIKEIKTSQHSYAIDIIEKCIYIGVYKDRGRVGGPHILKTWMNHETNSNYPVTNYLSMLKNPVKEPITYKPFDKEATLDILFGRISIYIGLNFDYIFDFAKAYDLEMTWAKKKELGRARQEGMDFFKINKNGISLSDGNISMILGDHFFSRIHHDFVLPSSMFLTYKAFLKEIYEEKLSKK